MPMPLGKFAPESHLSRTPRIAVFDSNPTILNFVGRVLSGRFPFVALSDSEAAYQVVAESPTLELVLLDWHLGEDATCQTAVALLARIQAVRSSLPVVVLSCSADPSEVLLANRMGAAEILLKPFTKEDVEEMVRRYVTDGNCVPAPVTETPLDENTSFVRCSKRMREIETQCALVARTDIPVLILGESGTGKEIAAMFIHKMSARSHRGFLKVNCAAMPLDLLESELFGYEQGAFTGAVRSKPGKFELCQNGTIFLDEIGEMPPTLQAKLLQVLQDGTFSRLGARTTVKVDVRVIAATNINIKAAIAKKQFREDLFYRLNGFGFTIPPLRERREEIPILARYFMSRISERYERPPLSISPRMMQALSGHSWPGNLRELENTIKRYIVLEDERAVLNDLNPLANAEIFTAGVDCYHAARSLKGVVKDLKGGAESTIIAQALEETKWNRKAAATDLQISYKALLYKIKQYQLVEPERA